MVRWRTLQKTPSLWSLLYYICNRHGFLTTPASASFVVWVSQVFISLCESTVKTRQATVPQLVKADLVTPSEKTAPVCCCTTLRNLLSRFISSMWTISLRGSFRMTRRASSSSSSKASLSSRRCLNAHRGVSESVHERTARFWLTSP